MTLPSFALSSIDVGPVVVPSATDALRILAVPVFCWVAWRDVQTRRVARIVWPPLLILGAALLGWDLWTEWSTDPNFGWQRLRLAVAISLGIVAPGAYLMHRLGGFGRADMKAVVTLAVLFPAYPTFIVTGGNAYPLVEADVGVFSLTILTNAILIGLAYPLALLLLNASLGRFTPVMVVGRIVPHDRIERTHGRLLETPAGYTRRGLDLDALRMYLRWRGCTLDEMRAHPAPRDPAGLPAESNPPTDGRVAPVGDRAADSTADGGIDADDVSGSEVLDEPNDHADPDRPEAPVDQRVADPWGAERFLDDVGSAYGTSPDDLREGLELLRTRDAVWVSPGMPFLVPLTIGLLVALLYGDLLFGAMQGAGLV